MSRRVLPISSTQAVPLVPFGEYTPITSIGIEILDRNHTMRYTMHGACPVVFAVLALEQVAPRNLSCVSRTSYMPCEAPYISRVSPTQPNWGWWHSMQKC